MTTRTSTCTSAASKRSTQCHAWFRGSGTQQRTLSASPSSCRRRRLMRNRQRVFVNVVSMLNANPGCCGPRSSTGFRTPTSPKQVHQWWLQRTTTRRWPVLWRAGSQRKFGIDGPTSPGNRGRPILRCARPCVSLRTGEGPSLSMTRLTIPVRARPVIPRMCYARLLS